MHYLSKLVVNSLASLALFGLLATAVSANPDNGEPLSENPDDNADREQVDISAEEILLIDVVDDTSAPDTSDDEDGSVSFTFGADADHADSGNITGPGSDPAPAGARYFEDSFFALVEITANTENWVLEVCNGGNGYPGLGGNDTGHSRGFSKFTEFGANGDQGGDGSGRESASFLALKTYSFVFPPQNNMVLAQGPNADEDHPTWGWINGSGNSDSNPGDNPEDATDCGNTTNFEYGGPETNGGGSNTRDGIADETHDGPTFTSGGGFAFEWVVGYDAVDGTFSNDSTTALWTLSSGTL